MLFDLRARGRRRTVQIVYLGLALLFGLTFIGFGVGTGFGGGGLFEGLFGGKEGTRGAGFAAQVSAAEARTRKNPNEAAAWAALAEAQFHESGAGEFFDESTQKFTGQGKALLVKVASSWNHYVALNPSKLNQTAAQEMLTVYSQEGLNEPAYAVEVLQLLIPAKPPSAALYGELASFAYQAKNPRVGDLASQKAVALSPAAQRAKVKAELERLKNNPTGSASGESSAATAGGQTVQVNTGSNATPTATTTIPTPAKKK